MKSDSASAVSIAVGSSFSRGHGHNSGFPNPVFGHAFVGGCWLVIEVSCYWSLKLVLVIVEFVR
ncbi:hypothetical protein RHMOL_Rhmol01G0143200 [Rhododendron molle]|uniref:Uncharacterized protein n=1 Tax=Rhododendron molle TaxID=49168 RepID=A0ACC0Q4E4_RHOML|nr:hypothetical protein RHMOL_Rhmol01G0143200 [Rhododendron molle]